MDARWTTHLLPIAPPPTPAADPGTLKSYLDQDALLEREWLLTNGTGAYAMGTALGANTRRYHGLLVAATRPPVGRVLALNQVHDRLLLNGGAGNDKSPAPVQTIELGSCLFRGIDGQLVQAPQGHSTLAEFRRGLTVVWTYRWGEVQVERELVLHDRKQSATILYRVSGTRTLEADATLRVGPMLTLRDFHGLTTMGEAEHDVSLQVARGGRKVTVRRGDVAVTMATEGGRFEEAPDWWHAVVYPRDTHRGQGDTEDHFVPGDFVLPLKPNQRGVAEAAITVTLGTKPAPARAKSGRASRLHKFVDDLPGDEPLRKALAIAADDFVVQRSVAGKKLSTILAGYPWFADWGRDTFIALTGLLLTTHRFNEARDVLRAFAGSIRDGLVPNRFDDYDDSVAHYNTVDASLWYVEAGLQYCCETESAPGWLVRAMRQIVDAYAAGTAAEGHDGRPLPIFMDADGLIVAGDDHSQLTWMDAACGDRVFTPRPGKCVEINALWFNALVGLAERLETDDPDAAARYEQLAARAKRSFVKTFWSDDLKRLIDHVKPAPGSSAGGFVAGEPDRSLRPNMLFACSLHASPLSPALKKATIAAAKRELLTTMGLRTLPGSDPNYHAHYAGPQFERDKSYHQGTVWPWLIGPLAEAILRAGNFSKKARAEADAVLQPLRDHLRGEGLGQVPEIADAAEPHEPRGCPAQAWSVAELLRVSALIEGE